MDHGKILAAEIRGVSGMHQLVFATSIEFICNRLAINAHQRIPPLQTSFLEDQSGTIEP